MATDTAAATTAEIASDRDVALDESAGQRILRQFAVFIACGYLVYLVLTAPAIVASLEVMHMWWTVPALAVVFGPGLALGPLAWRGSPRALRVCAGVAAGGYLMAVATWGFGWNGAHLSETTGIWFFSFCGLAAIAAALAMRPAYAFVVLVVVVVSTITINYVARGVAPSGLFVPDMAWAFAFSLVYFAAAVMGMRTATVLDDTRAQAYRTAAAAAASQARANERQRFNQLTHDGVMATLLVAARRGNSTQLAAQAQATLHALDRIRGDTDTDGTMTPDAVLTHLSEVTATVDPTRRFEVRRTIDSSDAGYPATVVRTVAAAAAEAVRNSGRHAQASTTIVSVEITDDRLQIEVADDGHGFDPSTVPADRLGIAISIRERMSQIGGSATIESAPMRGTRVFLEWVR
ncbi:sensor histidine kinase [Gordonia sp. SCSIO 19800]|uniref:sensor histidine kinase n=1 Tax=Gordonia sp. SCSIO 19800 TaxID=2826926 RepID=UPI001B8420D9|nr:ATP-binding protein [Gordonia sp. SCSIO 19800]MBR7191558.1 ATP-binding protein [Gordonia sp. SCSIO 19800]